MPSFGASLEEFSTQLESFFNQEERDFSMDIVIHLALAYLSYKRLEKLGIHFEVANKPTILPGLERAWRELLYLRISSIPAEMMMSDIDRPLYLTRTGQVSNAKPITFNTFKRYYSDSLHQDQHRERDANPRRTPGLRTRRTRQPLWSKDTGSDREGS